MIKINKFSKLHILAVLVLVFLGTSSLLVAADEDARFKPIADEMIAGGGISWSPKVNYYRLVLTIARPDGSVFSKTFDSGSTPYVGLSSIFGESADNGSYTYELSLVPDLERRWRESNEDTLIARTRDRRALPRKGLTQSGSFTVKDGMIVTDGIAEPETPGSGMVMSTSTSENGISRPMDYVINDDLIVIGSACVGFDCVNGENFGFDTLRLKENNLRIKFQDTSVSASFPSNDWQITANDSANGGANKFSIDDIDGGRTPFTIEASAPSNSLYVDDGGRVGFGTSTPVVDLHVKSGNTPTLRLEQDGSSGFTPQTWDVAGNETNFFVRDATNGSQLPFKIKPGADHNSLVIDSDNDIGIGILSPSYPVHLLTNSSTNAEILAERSSGAKAQFGAAASLAYIGARTDHEVRFQVNSDWRLRLNPTSNSKVLEVRLGAGGGAYSDGTDWFPSSSREVKENINSLTDAEALRALNDLNPVRYNYKINKKEERVGFIAEDVPELVAVNGRKHLNAMDIVAVLTKVVQQQQQSLREQQQVISELKTKVTELDKKQK
jgi:hypothetical protein